MISPREKEAIIYSKNPEPVTCPNCNEIFHAPMDKLSIHLYFKCLTCTTQQATQDRLFELMEQHFINN